MNYPQFAIPGLMPQTFQEKTHQVMWDGSLRIKVDEVADGGPDNQITVRLEQFGDTVYEDNLGRHIFRKLVPGKVEQWLMLSPADAIIPTGLSKLYVTIYSDTASKFETHMLELKGPAFLLPRRDRQDCDVPNMLTATGTLELLQDVGTLVISYPYPLFHSPSALWVEIVQDPNGPILQYDLIESNRSGFTVVLKSFPATPFYKLRWAAMV